MWKAAPPLLQLALLGLVSANAYLITQVPWSEPVPSLPAHDAKLDTDARAEPRATGSSKPLGVYGTTLSRPVLFKSRQPYVAPPQPPLPKPPEVAIVADVSFRLGGVIITDQIKKAFLFRASEPKGLWVAEGEKASGWDVETIDARRTVLRRDGRTIELFLYPQR